MIKSITIIFIYILFGGISLSSFSQNSDNKIVISNKEELYTYELSKNGRAQVDAKYVVNYKCIKPSKVFFVEYYNNESEIKNVKIKGVKGVSPQYGMYKQENIFFSDSKACYFQIPFIQSDKEATVSLNKVYKNIRNFIYLPIAESYYTNSKTIKIITPDWIKVDILSQNLSENIVQTKERDEAKKTTTHIFQITNMPEYVVEEQTPSYIYEYPYITIVPRKATMKGQTTKYFETIDDLYQWSKSYLELIDTNEDIVKEKASTLIANCNSEEEKIKELCKWVQQSTRYIAFADGVAAYKPDDPQEVIAKKYGDCKGMSNLLKSLLIYAGFDARLAWVSTKDSGGDLNVENPIPFADHMICALYWNNRLHYFDPTVKSLSFGEIPEHIQGQIALVEDGENHIISQIPQYNIQNNKDSLFVQYSIIGNTLKGKAKRIFKGESKHHILYWIDNIAEKEKKNTIEVFLSKEETQDSIFNIETDGLKSFSPEVSLKYEINRKSNINSFGNQIYINLDDTKEYQNAKFNLAKRKSSFEFPYKDYAVIISELSIPNGYKVFKLPQEININRKKYSFTISYTKESDKIIYHKKISIFDPILKLSDFEQWNSDIDMLRKAYNELIVLERE